MTIELIRCRQCGMSDYKDLYAENYYHDVTCMNCGARSGKYGDENEAMNLWNGKGIKFYIIMWHGQLHNRILEMWDDLDKANGRAKHFMNMIWDGQSVLGHTFDKTNGYREYVTVEEIEPNIKYEIETEETHGIKSQHN